MLQLCNRTRYFRAPLLLTAVLVTTVVAARLSATETSTVVRIEEDWELVVDAPDPNSSGPQISCLSSPAGGVGGFTTFLRLNHQIVGKFAPGGVQLSLSQGDREVASAETANVNVLETSGETIRWTQVMYLSKGLLVVEVSGKSKTWGEFALKVSSPTTLTSLNGYDPSSSSKDSSVGFQSNRVKSLALTAVRCQTSIGKIHTDSIRRVVHQK